jgi:universal stress protein A
MSHVRKILVPVDGSPPSIAALDHAVALAEDLGATLEVIHIETPDRFEVGSATPAVAGARQEEDREMSDAVEIARGRLGDRVSRRTESGDPVRRILEAAREDAVDLVVIGTHGRVGRLHAILGSVAEAVVRNAPCPVLTVRESDGEAESFAERVHGRQRVAAPKPPSER